MSTKSQYEQCYQDERSLEIIDGCIDFDLPDNLQLAFRTIKDFEKKKDYHKGEIVRKCASEKD